MDERTAKLEDRMAFLEHDVEQLDGVVRELADRLQAMTADLARFRDDVLERIDRAAEPDEDDASS